MTTAPAARSVLLHPKEPVRGGDYLGEGLVLLIGAMRSGTTLLRKMLDSHPRVYSPAETWFALPLLDVWRGSGSADGFDRRQAAVGLQTHLDREGFLRCCRAFAESFYRRGPAGTTIFVDKTPLYLHIVDELIELLPHAKLIAMTRDPRAVLFSRATWRHTADRDPTVHLAGVAADMRAMATLYADHNDSCHLVRYEELCVEPERVMRALTDHLGIEYVEEMIRYGTHTHHEGYGDENTRQFAAPHVEAVARWQGALSVEIQRSLAQACGAETLHVLGMDEYIESHPVERVEKTSVAATTTTTTRAADGRRVLFFTHPGKNSRDILLDIARGFTRAGATVIHWDLGPVRRTLHERQDKVSEVLTEVSRTVRELIRSNGIDLSLGMWFNGLTSVAHDMVDSKFTSFFDLIESPHLLFWLDAPHWAHQGEFHQNFGSPLLASRYCFHTINNEATGLEMAGLMGFSNVLPCPYGINEKVFEPHAVEPDLDLVFAMGPGSPPPSPLMLRELISDEPDIAAIRQDLAPMVRRELDETCRSWGWNDPLRALADRLVDLQLETPGQPMLQRVQRVAEEGSNERAACETLLREPSRYVQLSQIIRQLESWRRPFVISYLSRHFTCGLFGEGNLEAWGAETTPLGYVTHEEQARTYCRGRVGLNVMRWQDDVGLNLKPLEIAASGVACLCERRPGLDEVFEPGREIIAFDTPGEARRLLAGLLDDAEKRRIIADAGRQRVLRDHTWTTRADQLCAPIGAATGLW